MDNLPAHLPEQGEPDDAVYAFFERTMAQRSARLGDQVAFAHMDPPPLDIATRLVGLNARYNQNLLHPDLSPFATEAEQRVIAWLAPVFGMTSGHMCGGSTLANLTALWCAREHGARAVVASADAHISVAKSAHILGMPCRTIPVDVAGRMDAAAMGDCTEAAVVLTAGTTGRGVIDPLRRVPCRWLHVDAAWAGPLRLTRYSDRLDGIEAADSVAISAHKWLYQPKDSAIVLFKSPDALSAVSFRGAYLATRNVGVQGSRGAAAIPLLATLMALGRRGLAQLIEKNMVDAEALAARLEADDRTDLKQHPETGVVTWRPSNGATEEVLARLSGTTSRTAIDGVPWARQVAANPHADVSAIWARIAAAL